MVAPSGEQYEIRAGGYRAVVTECGAGLRLLEHDQVPLVEGYDEGRHATSGRGQLLAPWPNRLDGGRYTFDGTVQQLALSEPARRNASHGLVRWTAWTLEEHTEGSVSLAYRLMAQSGYPWTLDLRAVHDLSADGLTVTVTATNLADGPAPYAVGAHPYLTVGDGLVDGWELTLPAATRVLTDDRLLPVGTEPVDGTRHDFRVARPIRDLRLDDAFTDLGPGPDGRTQVELRDPVSGRAVVLWMDDTHGWIQVFSGDDTGPRSRQSLAVEPMSAPANAFNSGDGLVVLGPAGSETDTFTASWGIRVG